MNEHLSLTCAPGNKRPGRTDDMRFQAADRLVARMIKSGLLDKERAEDSAVDIVKATRWECNDGYKIAKELEDRYHWDCDMQIAEELDTFCHYLDKIYDEAEKRWAAENPRDAQFQEGDVVLWRGSPAIVRGISEHRPQCYKVRQGEMNGDTSYYVVPFEDVAPVP